MRGGRSSRHAPAGSWAIAFYGPLERNGIDHATTHADALADSLHCCLEKKTIWETAIHEYHAQARGWSEKIYRRTSTFAADLRPWLVLRFKSVS